MKLLTKPKPSKTWTLRDFYENRKKVLILREMGGVGDILMLRMIFEDFKKLMPDARIVFACPGKYHELVVDHPFIDEVVDSTTVNIHDYLISYNVSTACGRYEMSKAPFSDKHRSDIWANHCGVELTSHDMHFRLPKEATDFGSDIVTKVRNKFQPVVLFCTMSAMQSKNLLDHQVIGTVEGLRQRNMNVITSHYAPIPVFEKLGVPNICGISLKKWMGLVAAVDYVISVDSAAFHMAGGLKKPVLGVYTWADGKVYGKWYPKCETVQKHRDDGDWNCGPCYAWPMCPKVKAGGIKPCLTEITPQMILTGFDKLTKRFPWSSNYSNT